MVVVVVVGGGIKARELWSRVRRDRGVVEQCLAVGRLCKAITWGRIFGKIGRLLPRSNLIRPVCI